MHREKIKTPRNLSHSERRAHPISNPIPNREKAPAFIDQISSENPSPLCLRRNIILFPSLRSNSDVSGLTRAVSAAKIRTLSDPQPGHLEIFLFLHAFFVPYDFRILSSES